MQTLKLDINPKGETPVLYVSQYDNGREFGIELIDGEEAYNVPSGYSVQLNVRKTDSKLVTKLPETVSGNMLTFVTTEQMTACPGNNIASLTLKDTNDIVITTLYFIIEVQRDVLAGGIDSVSDIANLTTQIDAITLDYLINNTDEIAEIIADKIYPTLEAYGDIATFNTILQLPLVSVTADPLATEITRCGKNIGLLSEKTLDNSQRINIEYENGGVKLTATGTYSRCMFAIKTEIGKTYTISFQASGTGNYNRIQFSSINDWSSSYGYINVDATLQSYSLTFTAISTTVFIGFYLTASAPTGEGIIKDFQLEQGSTLTAYEAYNGITKPIAEATTIKTLTGVNNVFTDYGPVTVEYKYFPDI